RWHLHRQRRTRGALRCARATRTHSRRAVSPRALGAGWRPGTAQLLELAAHMSFVVYPAIDVHEGRVVRLRQGDYAKETRYSGDPLAVALHYAQSGAHWLHLVDLDAAREGGYTLAPLLRSVTADGRLSVQTGGGVRDADEVQALLDAGAQRVVVGSVAIRDPDTVCAWLRRFGNDRIVLALDAR